jgi:hypothetical protein
MVWKPDHAVGDSNVRAAAFDYQKPGVGAFFRGGYVPEDRNIFTASISASLTAEKLVIALLPIQALRLGYVRPRGSPTFEADPAQGRPPG